MDCQAPHAPHAEVLQPGGGRYYPRVGDTVKIEYVIRNRDGKGIDWSRKPLRFIIGCDGLSPCSDSEDLPLPGMVYGVQQMTRDMRARFHVPSELGYGWSTEDPLAKNADLVIELELLCIWRAGRGPFAESPYSSYSPPRVFHMIHT